jgi:uncharacterized repeat protein (TIGR02543 family)
LHREVGRPLIVGKLHYVFDGWLGDALLTTTPCFIVTDTARNAIESNLLSGVCFADVEVGRSGEFDDLYPECELPHFWWLKVGNAAFKEDFGLTPDLRLVVSAQALETLRAAGIDHAIVESATR